MPCLLRLIQVSLLDWQASGAFGEGLSVADMKALQLLSSCIDWYSDLSQPHKTFFSRNRVHHHCADVQSVFEYTVTCQR